MSRLPSTGPSLQRYLRQQARAAQRQQQSSAFALSGTSVTAEGVVTVDGELDVTGAMVVGGTLSLPNGIINNDALASPVVPQYVYFTASNFSLTTAQSAKATSTVTVPAGFTTAVVSVTGRIYAANPNTTGGFNSAGGDFFYARTAISGAQCSGMPLVVLGSDSSGINIAPFSTVLPGLTGGDTFTISVSAFTVYQTWAASTSNAADVSGTILWFR